MTRHLFTALVALGVGAAATACHPEPPAQTTAVHMPRPAADGQYHPPIEKDMPQGAARLIGTDMGPPFDACGATQIRFAFDASTSLPQVERQLRDLATCLNTPPNEKTGIGLVGRADPRGTDDYNDELAARRATFIKKRLVGLGVAPERVVVSSRGERESVGARPEYSYGYDRRVDVVYFRKVIPSKKSLAPDAPHLEKPYEAPIGR